MEKENVSLQIVNICKKLDKKAVYLYNIFLKNCGDKSLKEFWKNMYHEEQEHVEYWKYLEGLARHHMLPQIFDNPYKIRKDLEAIEQKVNKLLSQNIINLSIEDSFYIAYQLEFYLMYPAFEQLFSFLPHIFTEKTSPSEKYKSHIEEFISYINKYEIEHNRYFKLMGEAIKKLWDENRKISIHSQNDDLTDVLNRRGFFRSTLPLTYLAHRNKIEVGVMMLDIDDFKKINDIYGHLKGDDIVKQTADYLKSSLRGSDIIGRYGGDEFITFLYQIERGKLINLSKKILQNAKDGINKNIKISLSIGLSHGKIEKYPDKEFSDMIMRADNCLLKAKKNKFTSIEI